MAQLMQVSTCLITSVTKSSCTVQVVSQSKENPFLLKERLPFKKDDLCRQVVDQNETLFFEDLDDQTQFHDMKCYLGTPLRWPNGSVYGTLSLLDTRVRKFEPELMAIFEQLHQLTEFQLSLIYEREQHSHTKRSLEDHQLQYKEHISRDTLTGAYNRKTLQELAVAELSRATRKSGSFALVLLDIDHFKQINDEYGHLAGDAVLKHLVDSMQDMLRQSDFVARFSAEEFCLLMPEMDPAKVYEIIDRLRKKIAVKAAEYNGESVYYTVSFGCALFESGMITTVEELLNMAETALNEAKRTGRNKVCMATVESYEEALYSAL